MCTLTPDEFFASFGIVFLFKTKATKDSLYMLMTATSLSYSIIVRCFRLEQMQYCWGLESTVSPTSSISNSVLSVLLEWIDLRRRF